MCEHTLERGERTERESERACVEGETVQGRGRAIILGGPMPVRDLCAALSRRVPRTRTRFLRHLKERARLLLRAAAGLLYPVSGGRPRVSTTVIDCALGAGELCGVAANCREAPFSGPPRGKSGRVTSTGGWGADYERRRIRRGRAKDGGISNLGVNFNEYIHL